MTAETRELIRLLEQSTLRLAQESVDTQARPMMRLYLPTIGLALICICLGVGLAVGLLLLGDVL